MVTPMKNRPYILSESNWKDIKTQPIDLVVLPGGATEAHNYPLPCATANYQADAIAAETGRIACGERSILMFLPVVPFGVNPVQADIRLDMNTKPSTQRSVLRDLIEVLERQGFRKLLVLNGHGGNDFKPILRELGLEFPGIYLALCDWFRVPKKEKLFEKPGDHADEMETSLMMYLHGDLVRPLEESGDGHTRQSVVTGIREGWAWSERTWSQVTEDTGTGAPSRSTDVKGERVFREVTEKIGSLMSELCQLDLNRQYE